MLFTYENMISKKQIKIWIVRARVSCMAGCLINDHTSGAPQVAPESQSDVDHRLVAT